MTLILNGTDNNVSIPAIQGSTGGTSAGVYYPAANTVAIVTSGANALTINSTQAATFASTLATAARGITSGSLPSGSILQVASAYKTDTQTVSSGAPTFVDISGLSVTLTPQSSSSKFLCIYTVVMGNGADLAHGYIRLNRNGTAIALADAASNRTTASACVVNTSQGGQTLSATNSYLDSPATASAVTYKLTVTTNNVNPTYINRSSRDTDNAYYDGRSTSSITVLEIA